MRNSRLAACILAALTMGSAVDTGTLAAPLVCPKEAGLLKGPLVPTRDAARRIYAAVVRALKPAGWQSYRHTVVSDAGDNWQVFQWAPPVVTEDPNDPNQATVATTAGGGTFELEIKKCDGSMKAALAR